MFQKRIDDLTLIPLHLLSYFNFGSCKSFVNLPGDLSLFESFSFKVEKRRGIHYFHRVGSTDMCRPERGVEGPQSSIIWIVLQFLVCLG
ncbi:hypothetical protein PanWU01x14_323450 [Parasponia andersonii]|uniref:Uncharacterized protein n=1 Tax=Parasponia andersonii TaxID=3476 RepID=A0A2P5AKH4_PARAD|nr:hypothetical protein PanWU01x14_323450 [Parasponia andersonii]